jgi:hypothetical protein
MYPHRDLPEPLNTVIASDRGPFMFKSPCAPLSALLERVEEGRDRW